MINKLKAIKMNYAIAKENAVINNDVVELIDLFIELFDSAKNVPHRLEDDLRQDLTPPMGGTDNVITTAEILKENLLKCDKNTVASKTGVCVSRAIIALINSKCIEENQLNKINCKYIGFLSNLEISIR
ncbi:hypothetical protein [Tatumella sp. UCD-D_suzukii]|uniref:hypothetical protein n=1 Tax=Tatumella sp. UCD-D_suzukii TaxID=1408192 RepID=UPI00046FE346|nr:hypothetical protein [Tatumella sp. UCD-D_suzukii]